MTTDELKAAAELWRLGRETPTQERIELVRQLAGVVGDAATERKFRQASNMLADWAVERLITEPQQYEYIATLERERDELKMLRDHWVTFAKTLESERDEARSTVAWVCRKLGIPEDSALSSGEKTIAGEMHVLAADAHGYKVYIKAFKCDDKQGAIARLAVERDEARAAYCKLRQDVADTHYLCEDDDRKDKSDVMATIANDLAMNSDKPEWRKGGDA